LINAAVPDTIPQITAVFSDVKSKPFLILENHRRCLDAASKIGCQIVNISSEDLVAGKPYLVFGLLWQIIRAGMLYAINIHQHPELMQLCNPGEVHFGN
jgi:hypothetical protein